MPNRYLKILVLSFLFISSCAKHEVEVPSYLYLGPTTLITKSDNSQGYPSQLIQDYYVFANGETRGLMATGSTIPLQHTGKTRIKIGAGIKYNGMAEQKAIYPMFDYYEQEIDLKAERVDTIKPVFHYVDNTVFPLIEDYDANGFELEYAAGKKNNGDTLVRDNSSDAWFPGKYSGKVTLNSTEGDYMELQSRVFNNWPRFTPFYIELDYKGNIPIVLGMWATSPSSGDATKFPLYVLNPKEGWNKLYLNIESEINYREPNTQYRIFIGFSKNGVANPVAWIDNLKVVYLD